MKIMLLFVGTMVYLLPLVVEAVEGVDEVYLQTATTLGATRWQLVRHVLVPGSLPAIGEALRVMNGIGWTYVILAEIVNARYGLGHLITVAGKRSHVDQIFAGVHRHPGHRRGQRRGSSGSSTSSSSPGSGDGRDHARPPLRPGAEERLQDLREPRRQGLPGHPRRGPGDQGRAGRGRVPRLPGAVRLRQEHHPEHRGRPLPTHHRPGAAAGPAHHGAGPGPRHGLPELQLVPLAHRPRQRGLRPEAAGRAARRARARGPGLDQEGGPGGHGAEVPGPALRRDAAAGGHRAHAGREARRSY